MTPRVASTTAKSTTPEQVISYKDICQEFKNQFKNSSKTKKNCIDLFHLNSKFIKTITQAFGFKKEKDYWMYNLNNPIKTPNHLNTEVE